MATYYQAPKTLRLLKADSILTADTYSDVFEIQGWSKYSLQVNVADVQEAGDAVTAKCGEVQIDDLTFEASAAMDAGEYLVLTDGNGLTWAAYAKLVAAVAQVDNLTFEALAAMVDGEYAVIYTSAGNLYAIAADTTGAEAVTPSGAIWGTIDAANKAIIDFSSTTDAASVAALFESSFNALPGFTDEVTLDDTAADGSMIVTQDVAGACTEPVSKLEDDSGVGGITIAQTTNGVSATAAPTGPIWDAIPAARKTLVDLSAGTTNVQTAAAFEVALNALTGFTSVITLDDTAADGTMVVTQVIRGPVDIPLSKLEDDSGAGDIGIAQTNLGVASTVAIASDSITIASHGLTTGAKVVLTIDAGTLPAGLALATDYYAIIVDANTIKLASSLANAIGGVAVDITDQGTDGSTITATPENFVVDVNLQASLDQVNWFDVESAQDQQFTAAGSILFDVVEASYPYVRIFIDFTSGVGTFNVTGHAKPH